MVQCRTKKLSLSLNSFSSFQFSLFHYFDFLLLLVSPMFGTGKHKKHDVERVRARLLSKRRSLSASSKPSHIGPKPGSAKEGPTPRTTQGLRGKGPYRPPTDDENEDPGNISDSRNHVSESSSNHRLSLPKDATSVLAAVGRWSGTHTSNSGSGDRHTRSLVQNLVDVLPTSSSSRKVQLAVDETLKGLQRTRKVPTSATSLEVAQKPSGSKPSTSKRNRPKVILTIF